MAVLGSLPLRGRDRELGVLGDGVARAVSGRLTIVVVEGEAGIGKSRLLAEALADARARGVEVCSGRAEELERTRPFGVWAETLGCSASSPDARRARVAALLAPHAGEWGPITVSSDPSLQFQAIDALVDLVEALALERPLVVGLDDLQWADPSSLLTLATLARHLTYAPVALIACLRPEPSTDVLQRALATMDAAGADRLRLGRLADDAVGALVASVVAATPGERLMAALAGAGGNPLFVTELLAALLQEGAIRTVNGRAEVAETTLPPTLRLTILRHVSYLPDDTLDALRPATILGSGFLIGELATTTARSALELSAVLAPAITAGILADDGDRLRFRHDLIRDAVYQDLPTSVRRALHREAGRRLAEEGAPAMRVAEHLGRGAVRGDADAVAWLTRAARVAAPSAPGVAAELLERAVDLADPADPGRDRLLAEGAGSLWWAGRNADAESTCRGLLGREHDPSVEGPARVCLARVLIAQGRMADALEALEPLEHSPALSEADQAGAWAWASMARLSLGDLDGAVADAGRARAVAAGDHATTSLAITCQAVVNEFRGNLREAVRIIDEAVRLADRSPQRVGHRYPVHVTRGHILMEADRLADARHTLQAGLRISEELGVRWALPSFQVFLAVERFFAGEWDDAIAEFETALELAEETDERYSLVLGGSIRARIALHRGDLQRAEQEAGTAEAELAAGGARYRGHWATWVRALLLEAGGAVPEAYTTLARCWDACAASGLAVEYPVLGPDLVRLALAAGEEGRAEQVTRAVADLAAAQQVPSLTGAALRCQGLLARDPELLVAAVDAYERSPRALEPALAREDAAAALAAKGDPGTAGSLLQQARGTFEHLDAARDLARVDARLRDLGVRRGRRGRRRRPSIGWESLTPTERKIVDLVAEGLSNPQVGERLYVSRRTVQTHLAHVFAKLDVSSRAQLAVHATRHGDQARGFQKS
jgi:DNA-binding CsgD family transcriptional regulator/tetratricopeptide (TPR) repeat protein